MFIDALVPGEFLAHSVGLLLIPTLGPVLAVSGVVVYIAVKDRRDERKRLRTEGPDAVDEDETSSERAALRTFQWAAMAVAVALLPACGSETGSKAPESSQSAATTPDTPTATAESVVTVDVVIADGAVTPTGARPEIKVGQKVVFAVTSDVAEVLHVHSDPEQSFDVKPGRDQRFPVTIKVPGQVEVEAENLGISIATLVVRP